MTMSFAMRREAVYRVWTTCVAIAACASGIVLWQHGERLVGGFGLATACCTAVERSMCVDAHARACNVVRS